MNLQVDAKIPKRTLKGTPRISLKGTLLQAYVSEAYRVLKPGGAPPPHFLQGLSMFRVQGFRVWGLGLQGLGL